MTLSLGWFSTGRGPGSYGMLEKVLQAIDRGDLDVRIEFVFSNRERGEGDGSDRYFDLVESKGIPLVTFSSPRFRRLHGGDFAGHRLEYDQHVIDLLSGFSPDLCVLAGYLLIFSTSLCAAFDSINLHPALPSGPKGLWQSVIWDLVQQGSDESGAMIFLVTETVDEGPPVTFTRFPIKGESFDHAWNVFSIESLRDVQAREGEENYLFQLIRSQGVRREPLLLLETIKKFATGQIRISEGMLVGSNESQLAPIDLTVLVERQLQMEGY